MHVKTLVKASEEALKEMSELKSQVIVQNNAFMKNMDEINTNLNNDCKALREQQNKQLSFITDLRVVSQDHKGDIDQLFSRMEKTELKVANVEQMAVDLGISKCN